MSRSNEGVKWQLTGAIYATSAALAGVISGAALGGVGSTIPTETRVFGLRFLALVGISIGLSELLGRRFSPLQCDRETPRQWVDRGALRWGIMNGAALGWGARSRIGFWLWYVVPCSAVFSGRPLAGASIYAAYALARAGAGVALTWYAMNGGRWDKGLWLIMRTRAAKNASAGYLVLFCSFVWIVT